MEAHAIIYLDTLSPNFNSVIGSICCVKIEEDPLTGKYEISGDLVCEIDIYSSYKNSYMKTFIDMETIGWKLSDRHKYRQFLSLFQQTPRKTTIHKALSKLSDFLVTDKQLFCWSERPAFDIAMLNWSYFELVEEMPPWKFENERDLQTLKAIINKFPKKQKEEDPLTVCKENASILCQFLNKRYEHE